MSSRPPVPVPVPVPVPALRRSPPVGSAKYRAILNTAEELFGQRGFKKTGVEEIAAQAGVSKPLIYRYFKSKEHLFEVVVDRVVSEWCDVISAEAARVTPSPAHTLRLVVRASLEFAASRSVLRGLLARENQLMLAGYSDVLERGTDTLRRVVRETLERGARIGDVRTDLDASGMADVITEVCVRFGDLVLSSGQEAPQGVLFETIIETLLHGVIAQRAPSPFVDPPRDPRSPRTGKESR